MNLDLCLKFDCPCTGKNYRNSAGLKAHQKTNVHIHWETQKLQKEEIIKINRLEIENSHLRRLNLILMERICELEKNNVKS